MMTASPNRRYSGHHKAKRATKEYLEKRSGERNVDSRLQVQLLKDGGGSTRQSWMETSGLWPMLHLERHDIGQVEFSNYQHHYHDEHAPGWSTVVPMSFFQHEWSWVYFRTEINPQSCGWRSGFRVRGQPLPGPTLYTEYLNLESPLPSDRHHLSCDDCLEDKREDYQNCSVLYCVPQLYTVTSTHIWAVLTGVLGTGGLGLDVLFWVLCAFCVFYLGRANLFILFFSVFSPTCLKRLVSESMTCVERDAKLYSLTWIWNPVKYCYEYPSIPSRIHKTVMMRKLQQLSSKPEETIAKQRMHNTIDKDMLCDQPSNSSEFESKTNSVPEKSTL